jgi:hypothetical protein
MLDPQRRMVADGFRQAIIVVLVDEEHTEVLVRLPRER